MAKDEEPPSCQREIKPIQKLSDLLIERLNKNRLKSVEIHYYIEGDRKQEYGAAVPFYFFYFISKIKSSSKKSFFLATIFGLNLLIRSNGVREDISKRIFPPGLK